MSSSRKQKDDRQKRQLEAERRGKVLVILRRLGLEGTFDGTSLLKLLLTSHYPKPTVDLAQGQTPTDEIRHILKELQVALKSAAFDCPILGNQTSIVEYLEFVLPIVQTIGSAISPHAAFQIKLEAAQCAIEEVGTAETGAEATLTLLRLLEEVVIKYGRIDRRHFYITVSHGRNQYDKWFVAFNLHSKEPVVKSLRASTKPRPAYLCGQPFGVDGMNWVEWPASIVGIDAGKPAVPVYVQEHALDNLYDRTRFIQNGEWLIHDNLWSSLREPRIIRNVDGKFWVEYLLFGHKLGYLIASYLEEENAILVDTFLFLTMDETPEGRALHSKLKLSRHDKEYLELDKIHTFLLTDVRHDPELVRIFGECGCGHLFSMLKDSNLIPCDGGYAREIRKYLKLNLEGL